MLEELKRMYRFKLEPVRAGHCDTIADVYNEVILENEIDRDVVVGWWDCLREYALSDDALVFVRKLEHGGRRGFASRFSNRFGYVFCDNSLAKCIYALARRNIVPTPDQFRECVRARRLPCLMKTNGDEIGNPACVFCKGSKPSLGGRKLAHILSTNKDYSVDYSEFQSRHFAAGDLTDWRFDNDFGYYTRRMGMLSPCYRRIFVAHFLRFTNPMNYFLFPLKRRMGVVDFGKDLSEHYDMTDFMRYVRYEQYRVFREFEKLVLYSHRARAAYEVLGGERVDLSYGPMREERDNAEVHGCAARRARRVGGGKHGKANARIAKWAVERGKNPHKIISAFYQVAHNGEASFLEIKQLCQNGQNPRFYVPGFKGSWASLLTDAGNSYGKVFERHGDVVTVWDEVLATLEQYKNSFIR